ncbi:MAG TPA: BTAD domain-containing putative transcriptional regulator [Stellaceae bacterium]|nr:BTAD domain-containing putative transcriptional regulator [Stellaceae bacterium]
MALIIGVLGHLTIENDQRRVGKLPRKARALVAYLAVQGERPVSRERLSDLLWPYQGSEQARHSLRNCLLELRKTLGEGSRRHLVAEFANCRLQDVDTDLSRFEQLSRSADRAELLMAAELYRDEFLADFVIDSEPFQEWLASERDRTLDLICGVLQRLTALHDQAGEHDAAIRSARRLASLDALSEIGQRALIRAYARAGRRPEALRQYRTCADILKRELGVAPDAETQALANEIARAGGSVATVDTRLGARPPEAGSAVAISAGRGAGSGATLPEIARLRWPCLLPRIAVAVAPLRNLTGASIHQHLFEAFTDDLVTDLLEHGRGLSVKHIEDAQGFLGNNSLSSKLGSPELDCEYVVSGSAQLGPSGSLRVNMRIMHIMTAEYRWAGRHEFTADELASGQTEITRLISRELHVLALQEASRQVFANSDRELFGLSDCLSRGAMAFGGDVSAELMVEAQRWYLAALARDPRNVEALAGLAFTCQHVVGQPWWTDPDAVAALSDLGREAVAIALDLAPGHTTARCIQGMLYSAAGQLEEAASAFDLALSMDQDLAIAHSFSGYNAAFLGRAEKTLPAVERAMGLDRTDRRNSVFFFFGGFAELLLGRTEAAIALLRKSLERNPAYGSAQLFLVAALLMVGRKNEAARAAAAFRDQYPGSRVNDLERLWLARSTNPIYRTQIDPIFDRLRSLGLGG